MAVPGQLGGGRGQLTTTKIVARDGVAFGTRVSGMMLTKIAGESDVYKLKSKLTHGSFQVFFRRTKGVEIINDTRSPNRH